MREINRSTLIEALSTLPEYDPPAKVWQAVETDLDLLSVLPEQESMAELLPEYDPPANLWQNIQNELDKGSRVVPLNKWLIRIAATIALLTAAWWALHQHQPAQEEAVVSYSIEVMNPLLEKNDWDEDEDAFQKFMSLCQTGHFICQQPSFKNLESELKELTEAKNLLKEAIGTYGTSPELVLEMKEIELQRTDILKKMMAMLI